MITHLNYRYSSYDENAKVNKYAVEIACLSTDTKPTQNITTGSSAIEVDTGDFYLYDEASHTWNKMCTIKE